LIALSKDIASKISPDVVADLEETPERRKILEYLQSKQAVKISKIAKELKMTPGSVHHHTDILQKFGLIKKWVSKMKRAYAQITPEGEAALKALRKGE
jgi:DNA-binding MarR family transcriptional regulator